MPKTAVINFDHIKSADPKVKYAFLKELIQTASVNPEVLYKYYDTLATFITDKNNIIKWTGIDLIAYLSSVDELHKTDNQLPELIKILHGGQLISCNHAIFALGIIAQNKTQHRFPIIKELLSIEKDSFETEECKNIAIGKVLEVLKKHVEHVLANKEVIRFIQKATKNTRSSTQKKAIQLMNKIQKFF